MKTESTEKPMRSVWDSLPWKEWHEHKWKLLVLTAILFCLPAIFVIEDIRSILLGVTASLIGYAVVAGGLVGMSVAAGENTRKTMALLQSQPVPMWKVALVKLLMATVTVSIPIVLVVLATDAIIDSSWISSADAEHAVEWESMSFPLCWGITDWTSARIVGGVLGTCSLLLWMAAVGVNRSDEIRAGALGFLVIAIVWLSFAYASDRAVRAKQYALEEGIQVLMAAAPGGPAFVNLTNGNLSRSSWPFILVALIGHGCLLAWYLRQYGRVLSKPARFVNESPASLAISNTTRPPFRSQLRAVAWKQFRETAPLVFAAAGLVVAMVVLYFAFGFEGFRLGEVGAVLGGISISVAFLTTMVAGIGVYLEDLKPHVHSFWRSRPLNLGMWFGIKFVVGWIVLATTFGGLLLVSAILRAGPLPNNWTDVAMEIGFFTWLFTLIYTLAMGTYCVVRQPLYAAVITLGILSGGIMIANLLLEGIELPWYLLAGLLFLGEGIALIGAWLAVRNNWGWHK